MNRKYEQLIDGSVGESLIGRSVIRVKDEPVIDPVVGKVVAANSHQKVIWVLWPNSVGDPVKQFARELLLVKAEPMDIGKSLSWHGKSFGALEKFLEQARVEGADEDTELNPGVEAHVHIKIQLPLATQSKPDKGTSNPFPNPADFVTTRKPVDPDDWKDASR